MGENSDVRVAYLMVIRQTKHNIKHETNTSFRPLMECTVQEKSNNSLKFIVFINKIILTVS